jgi:hypothetical protein
MHAKISGIWKRGEGGGGGREERCVQHVTFGIEQGEIRIILPVKSEVTDAILSPHVWDMPSGTVDNVRYLNNGVAKYHV